VSDGLVSVITPFFNARRYLGEAIESVLAQSYAPIELVLVDDGSSDGSADSVAGLIASHTSIRLLRLPQNGGQAAARNVALRAALGKFVTFLDADDLMLPGRVAFQVDYLLERPGVDIVIPAAEYLLEPGVDPPDWLRQGPVPNRGRNPMTMLARRTVFDRLGLFDPSYRIGEDTDWLLRAAARGAVIASVDRVLTRRRLHGANLTYRAEDMRKAIQRMVLHLVRDRIADRRRQA
jgi:glycosyltransferase involved in cell wall biosynthesis